MSEDLKSIESIYFENLKSLRDVTISIGKGVTCILGANGTGKSTILHALSCVYQPLSKTDAYNNLSSFFTPDTNQTWSGSKFLVKFRGEEQHIEYRKADRWLPRRTSKPKRDTHYIGLTTCVPAIESEATKTKITITKRDLTKVETRNFEKIRKYMNHVMKKKYENVFEYKRKVSSQNDNNKAKIYIGVSEKRQSGEESTKYSSLTMSAGEQRCIQILRVLVEAREGSIILIEELDVLIHEAALLRLVEKIVYIAQQKKLQIVFSCHNSVVRNCKNVDFRYLHRTYTGEIHCDYEIVDSNLYELTGRRSNILTVYVEDEFSKSLIERLLDENSWRSKVDIKIFGAAINAFSLLAGLHFADVLANNKVLIVLDGDIYRTSEEQLERLKQVLTGDEDAAKETRTILLNNIVQYKSDGIAPELYIKDALLNSDMLGENEFVDALARVGDYSDPHKIFTDVYDELGMENRQLAYAKTMEYFFQTSKVDEYVSEIKVKIKELIGEEIRY